MPATVTAAVSQRKFCTSGPVASARIAPRQRGFAHGGHCFWTGLIRSKTALGRKAKWQKGALRLFENLSERLSGVFDRLTKQGALSDDDVKTALREVRVALLEADVSLSVARDFVKAVQDKATGQAVTKSVTPGQQVVKIVHDELVHVLAGEGAPGALKIDNPPAPILMVGLQGSGKTTTAAQLADALRARDGAAAMGPVAVMPMDGFHLPRAKLDEMNDPGASADLFIS